MPVSVPEQPDVVGALGAALYAERGRRPHVVSLANHLELPSPGKASDRINQRRTLRHVGKTIGLPGPGLSQPGD